MADVLLTHSNHLYYDRKQVRKMQPYPPLQTLLAAACLRQSGYSVALFDATLEAPESGFARALVEHRPRMVAVCEDNFNFLTKMCLLRNRELACWMAKASQEAGIPAIVNGADASDHAAEYLRAGFACVVKGEVEEAIVEVARHLLDGVGTMAELRAVAGTPHAPIENLDRLPMPAWDLVDASDHAAEYLRAVQARR